jgi:Ca2+-binding EF-hand superfamily protein
MTSRILTISLLALTAASLSFPAMAQPPRAAGAETRKDTGSWMLQRYDADGDGVISLQEFQAAGDAMFAQLDADGDGRISAEEFAAFERRHARGFARMDADGDGYVTKAEFDDARMARFNALDVNGNGVIDADELPARKGRKGHGKQHRGGPASSE